MSEYPTRVQAKQILGVVPKFRPGNRVELARQTSRNSLDIPVGTHGVVSFEPPIGHAFKYCVVKFDGFDMQYQIHVDDLKGVKG